MRISSACKKIFLSSALLWVSFINVNAQSLMEGFDDITLLPGAGWELINMSNPIGLQAEWVQGYSPLCNVLYYFPANSGDSSSFICGSFHNTAGASVISNWLLTPALSIHNNDTLYFYTRSAAAGANVYPDRLQVRMNQSTTSNVGTDSMSVGDFTDLLLDINPTYTAIDYPFVWTRYEVPVSGVPAAGVTGRFAFRYFVENAGPNGTRAFVIGIDDVAFPSLLTGVSEIKNMPEAFIGPNPVTNYIRIRMQEPVKVNTSLKILNAMGQVVYSTVLQKGFTNENFSLSFLAAGYYNLYISGNTINIRKSFIKN